MVKYNFNIILSVCFLMMLISPMTLSQPIANIDRSVVAIDDTFTLTLRVNDSGSYNSPDLSELGADFHILGNTQSSRHMISNGQAQSWTEWTITLMPKRQGELTIPVIDIDGKKTKPLTISVQPAVPHSSDTLQAIFIESEVDRDSVYVQQQLIFTLRIFHSILLDNMNITEPEFDDAAIEKLSQNTFQRKIQNSPYRVHELRYAIFPQKSGELIIPEQIFTASEAVSRRSVFTLPGQGKPIRKMSQHHFVEVLPALQPSAGGYWLPAKSLKLIETWSNSPSQARVGESITRTITLSTEGLLDSQLPPYNFPAVSGLKFYPDQGSTNKTHTEQGVLSTRSDSVAIIPTKAGTLELPEVRVDWWDTASNKLQQAIIPARTLTIAPALNNAQSSATPLAVDHSSTATIDAPLISEKAQQGNNSWQLIAALLLLTWLFTLFKWWQLKQQFINTQPQSTTLPDIQLSERQAFKRLTTACKGNDIYSIRQAIIDWSRSYWPEEHISCLQDVQRLSQHSSLTAALLQLDNTLFGKGTPTDSWNGENLLSIIGLIRQNSTRPRVEEQLPPLYGH